MIALSWRTALTVQWARLCSRYAGTGIFIPPDASPENKQGSVDANALRPALLELADAHAALDARCRRLEEALRDLAVWLRPAQPFDSLKDVHAHAREALEPAPWWRT